MWRALVALILGLGGAALAAEPLTIRPREVPAVRDILLPPGAIRTFGDTRFRHPGGTSGSALSPDGKRLATAAWYAVIVWDAATGRALWRADPGTGGLYSHQPMLFSPDGSKLVLVRTNYVCVWDAVTGRELHRIRDPRVKDEWMGTTFDGTATFTLDGKHLVLARIEHTGNVSRKLTEYYDTGTWARSRSEDSPTPVVFSPAGPTAISFEGYWSPDRDWSVVFSDPLTGQAGVRFKGVSARSPLADRALSPDGKALALVGEDGAVEVRRVPSGEELWSLPALGRRWGGRCTFTPDSKALLVGRPSGILRLDLATGKESTPILQRFGSALHVLPDGDTLLVCADGLVHRWSLATGKEESPPDRYSNLSRAAVSANGRRLAIGDRTGRVDLWDLVSGERILVIREPANQVTALVLSPDGRALAIGRNSGEVELRDAPSGRLRSTYQATRRRAGEQPSVGTLLFSPDGRTLLAKGSPGLLEAWDTTTGKRIWLGREAEAFSISPDGRTLVSSLAGPNVVISDAVTGAERGQIKLGGKLNEMMGGEVPALAFAPDGRRLFIATRDQRIRVCDPVTAQERSAFVVAEPLKTAFGLQGSALEAMAFSPDGRWLVTGGDDRTVRVWEVDTKREVRRFIGHDSHVRMVAFGPGARTVLSAGMDGAVYQWDLRPQHGPVGRSLWDDLAADDAGVAYRATWALIDDPAAAVELLRSKVRPAVSPKAEEVARLIDQLNAPKFADREAASRALAEFGPAAGPALRAALAQGPPAEERERLQKLLDRLARDPEPSDLPVLRGVQALELAGTPKARELLADWAAGAPEARLTEAAKAALARLGTK